MQTDIVECHCCSIKENHCRICLFSILIMKVIGGEEPLSEVLHEVKAMFSEPHWQCQDGWPALLLQQGEGLAQGGLEGKWGQGWAWRCALGSKCRRGKVLNLAKNCIQFACCCWFLSYFSLFVLFPAGRLSSTSEVARMMCSGIYVSLNTIYTTVWYYHIWFEYWYFVFWLMQRAVEGHGKLSIFPSPSLSKVQHC